MASMFHGASNVRISGSPSFTMISGGYHHYDHSAQVHISQTANYEQNTFTNNACGPTNYPSEAGSGISRDIKTPRGHTTREGQRTILAPQTTPTTNMTHPRGPVSLQPHPNPSAVRSSQSSSLSPTHGFYPDTCSESDSTLLADFQPWQVQQMDERTQAEIHDLMSTLREKLAAEDVDGVVDTNGVNGNDDAGDTRVQRPTGTQMENTIGRGVERTQSQDTETDAAQPLDLEEDHISPPLSPSEEREQRFSGSGGFEDTVEHNWEDSQHPQRPSQRPVVPPHVVQILRDLDLNPNHYGLQTANGITSGL